MLLPKVLVVDGTEDLSHQVERATAALRPRPTVVWCDGLEAVEGMLADRGPFDVLIAGPAVARDTGFEHLRRLRARVPQTRLILACDRSRSGSLREVVRTGALDLLRLPVSDGALVDSVEQALEMGWAAPVGPAGEGRKRGEPSVIAVVSGTGGCGKTFFATNLAYHLQSQWGRRACLIDLDLQFGELSAALRLKPKYTIADLLAHDDDDNELAGRLEEHLQLHDTGIKVLAAPDEPTLADTLDGTDVARVIEAARSRFDVVIVDTPAALSEPVLVALERADEVFALATLDLPSVHNLGVLLSTLKRLKVPPERVQLVLNKVEPDVGIDIDRVAKYFPQGFSMVIPYGREVNRSLNMGMPMLAYQPRSEVGKALEAGLARVAEPHGDDVEPVAEPRRLLGRRRKKPA